MFISLVLLFIRSIREMKNITLMMIRKLMRSRRRQVGRILLSSDSRVSVR